MPFYDYRCACGAEFDRLRSFSDKDEEIKCDVCGEVGKAVRCISVPGRAKVPGGTHAGRKAW